MRWGRIPHGRASGAPARAPLRQSPLPGGWGKWRNGQATRLSRWGWKEYTSGTVEVYRRETRAAIERFVSHRISFPDCIAALDAAFTRLIPRLTGQPIAPLRALMLANNAAVRKELARRGPPDENSK